MLIKTQKEEVILEEAEKRLHMMVAEEKERSDSSVKGENSNWIRVSEKVVKRKRGNEKRLHAQIILSLREENLLTVTARLGQEFLHLRTRVHFRISRFP